MADFIQGAVICSKGEPLRHLLIVTKGVVEASLGGHTFRFGQGDMLGLGALSDGTHSLTYTAASEVSLFTYPYDGVATLEALFREKEDIANILVNSMCRQITAFLQYHGSLRQEADNAYNLVYKIHPLYEKLCKLYAFSARKLPGAEGITSPSEDDAMRPWVTDYYNGIKELEPAVHKAFFSKTGVSLGFILKGADDIVNIISSGIEYQRFLEVISKVMLNPSGLDLFSVLAELHVDSVSISGADAAVETVMNPLMSTLSSMTYVDQNYWNQRLSTYKESLTAKRENREGPAVKRSASPSGEKVNLADSLNTILSYSGYPPEQCNKFSRLVHEYTQLSDRGSSDDVAHRMRRELTAMFNEVYKAAFMKSITDPALPTVLKMFLNFGYMDAALAGFENADYLYSIADTLCGDPDKGIYTVQEWLTAIYTGKKEPCRNEFDMDYAAHVAELKQQKRFSAEEEARMLADKELKLMFEIDQIFPVVNKLTFGRITTFCPIFSDNNVQRGLEVSLITPEAIRETLDEIRKVDFSAFYRETVFSNPEIGINRESVHVEIMPEVILMPNVGVRGIMWQEIEGRKRTTPSRMFMPLFLLTDLKPLLVRLTGEFRWEMCKRVQGSRWQDITEASLTSEYVDYLQFYRTNRDLSAEIKVAVKTELTRARNNYKNVFVANYSDWVLSEVNGSPRLNKYVRKILMMYCPFSSEFRDALVQNPQYAEPLKRFTFKLQQREHYFTRLNQKLTQTGVEIPQEFLEEMEYIKL